MRGDGAAVVYERPGEPSVELQPSPEAWAAFWRAVEQAGAWAWQSSYETENVLDGDYWTLRLEHEGAGRGCVRR